MNTKYTWRKTISFRKHIYDEIQRRRAALLLKGIEKTFTEMVNDLLEEILGE